MKKPRTKPPVPSAEPQSDGARAVNEFAQQWQMQVMLRMRRELTWLWRDQDPSDRLSNFLERDALAEERRKFFADDATARYLSDQLKSVPLPLPPADSTRGSLAWVAHTLELSLGEIFVVTLAFALARDAALGSLVAALQGDSRLQMVTLELAHRLLNDAGDLAPLTSSVHPLYTRGILRSGEGDKDWATPLTMPLLVARSLEDCGEVVFYETKCIAKPTAKRPPEAARDVELDLLASRMADTPSGLQIVPVALPFAQDKLDAARAAEVLQRLSSLTGRPVYALRADVAVSTATLESAGTFCWLHGADLLLPSQGLPVEALWQQALRTFPIYVFAAATDEAGVSQAQVLPTLKVAPLRFEERLDAWQRELKRHKLEAESETVRACAFRFRLDATAIAEVVKALERGPAVLTSERMIASCQQQVGVLIGSQAALVTPRFNRDELVLDAERAVQFGELLTAMRNLSRVYAEWGHGRAMSENGISAMFSGAPGTGKTMAAEVVGAELGLPMYTVDLSQVVNKYIGETEKNLRKLFDAAEQADIVLFFDEADSLFGQRSEVRSSNDRFANLEVSYLLQRMERFRGLAILATNRRKALDAAFLRRLRYVIEFPLPAETERLAIWQKSIPTEVSTDGVDFAFLAREFALAGGNIRSVVLNACLQAASAGQKPALSMEALMVAVDREYNKMDRPLTREQKAHWQWRPGAVAPAQGPSKIVAMGVGR